VDRVGRVVDVEVREIDEPVSHRLIDVQRGQDKGSDGIMVSSPLQQRADVDIDGTISELRRLYNDCAVLQAEIRRDLGITA